MGAGFCTEGCGDCCDPVLLRWPVATFEAHPDHQDNAAFMREHFTALTREEGVRRRGHEIPEGQAYFYECDMFDAETRTCTAYDERPPLCRDYPWYGDEPNARKLTDQPRCSFWHDVPMGDWPTGLRPLPILSIEQAPTP